MSLIVEHVPSRHANPNQPNATATPAPRPNTSAAIGIAFGAAPSRTSPRTTGSIAQYVACMMFSPTSTVPPPTLITRSLRYAPYLDTRIAYAAISTTHTVPVIHVKSRSVIATGSVKQKCDQPDPSPRARRRLAGAAWPAHPPGRYSDSTPLQVLKA